MKFVPIQKFISQICLQLNVFCFLKYPLSSASWWWSSSSTTSCELEVLAEILSVPAGREGRRRSWATRLHHHHVTSFYRYHWHTHFYYKQHHRRRRCRCRLGHHLCFHRAGNICWRERFSSCYEMLIDNILQVFQIMSIYTDTYLYV